MLNKPTDRIKDSDVKDHLDFLYENSFGNPIDLSAAPTAGTPLLEDSQLGIFAGILYLRKDMTIYVITPSSTITIT
jgi:hypothetical protein